MNYLCAGYKQFFTHIDPYMQAMAEEVRNQRPAANVMHRLNAAERPVRPAGLRAKEAIGRNDPCPCGSGRKYKHCCMPK